MVNTKAFFLFLVGFFLVVLTSPIWSQSFRTQYTIDAELKKASDYRIIVNQKIRFFNPTNETTNTIYLLDWSNAYKDSQTPLSKHLAEDFNRRFYLSSINTKGFTIVNSIVSDSVELDFQRLKDQPDIIKVLLPDFLHPNQSLIINLQYQIKIPSNRFTGIGVKNGERITLRNWYITLAPFIDGDWLLDSELDLSDNSTLPSDFRINWTLPRGTHVASNLILDNSVSDSLYRKCKFIGSNLTSADFVFSYRKLFEQFKLINGRTIETDIIPSSLSKDELNRLVEKIDNFIIERMAMHWHPKQMVLQLDHDKNPFLGLNLLPRWLDLYPDGFRFELEFLIAHLRSYLHNIPINKRKNHWIIGGLQTYMMIKYVEEYYPNLKFIGNISKIKLFESYEWGNLNFVDSFLLFVQAVEASQSFQPDALSKEKLTRTNQQTISPYRVGTGLVYLEEYFEENVPDVDFRHIIREYTSFMFRKSGTGKSRDFSSFFQARTDKKLDWFFDTYLNDDQNYDLSIKNFEKSRDQFEITLEEKNGKSLPVKVSFLNNEKEEIEFTWVHLDKNEPRNFSWSVNDGVYIAVNPFLTLADSNLKNNWRRIKTKADIKPIKLKLGFDIDDPTKTQIFYYPWTKYNRYDGVTIGGRFFNTQEKKQTFEFDFEPLYSIKEDTFVGNAQIVFNSFRDNKIKYRDQYSIYFNTFHYNTGLRYSVIKPTVRWFFRPSNLRSRKGHLGEISLYSVRFDTLGDTPSLVPNYDILSLRHMFSNREVIDYFTFESNIEFSSGFTKASFNLDYRRLQHNGSQLGLRFFMGKFLINSLNDPYFHFRLSKPVDYLFRYNVFGRSDDTGIFSQQFIKGDGGFKTDFIDGISDNFLSSINAYFGIWKFVELYGDFAIQKSKESRTKTFWDSGIRLNIVPDYFELYFPIVAKGSTPITEHGYLNNVRFTFFLHPNVFRELFNKRWE